MRKIERTEEPTCLRKHAAEWTEKYIKGLSDNRNFKFQWYRKTTCYHGENGIRARLNEMTQGHCAFCDGPLGIESTETVEHFYPKRRFRELAYQWDNLFPCCTVCQCKGERFTEGLLKPDADNYSFNRYFINNYQTGAVEPNPAACEDEQRCALVTMELYGLNSPGRKRLRLRVYKDYQRRDETETVEDFSYRFFLAD